MQRQPWTAVSAWLLLTVPNYFGTAVHGCILAMFKLYYVVVALSVLLSTNLAKLLFYLYIWLIRPFRDPTSTDRLDPCYICKKIMLGNSFIKQLFVPYLFIFLIAY